MNRQHSFLSKVKTFLSKIFILLTNTAMYNKAPHIPENKMKSIFFVILLMITVLLIGLTFHQYLHAEEFNQTSYCDNHYGNGTVVCHEMPMNMTMPVSQQK